MAISKQRVNYGEVLHYSLWARSCSLASSTVVTLSSLGTGGLEMGAVGRVRP